MNIGVRIAEKRKELGLTQNDLAEKLNVSNKTVSKWEMESGAPSIEFLPELAQIFNVTLDYLLTGEETYPDRQLFINGQHIDKDKFAKLGAKKIINFPEAAFKNIPCCWLDEWSDAHNEDAINELYRKQYPNKHITKLIVGVDRLLNSYKMFCTIAFDFGWSYVQFMKFRDYMLEQGYIEDEGGGCYKLLERDRQKLLEIVKTI